MYKKSVIHVIILAAGSGTRMHKKKYKQFLLLNGIPLAMHSIMKLFNIIPDAIFHIVLPEKKINYWRDLCKKHDFNIPLFLIKGGKNRYNSVKNALNSFKFNKNDMILIHDSARPFFTKKLVKSLILSAKKNGHAVPAIEVKDSLRKKTEQSENTSSVNRSKFVLTQTPQVFHAEIISKAYSSNQNTLNKTDDVSLIEDFIFPINLIPGEEFNFKITTINDWELAKIIAPNYS
tara:strand:+ start:117 stop:815 length:699 start_codon:yes stop_codon:yes gene_type:complete